MPMKNSVLAAVIGAALVSSASAAAQTPRPRTGLDDAIVTRNVDYMAGTDYADRKDRLDIYMPAEAENAPVLVFFHGGALMRGSKERGEVVAERLVPHGVGVVSANYRLSPAVMHPAHMEDAAAAVAWVIENIGRYGGDPFDVYVSGHSAGAYLAALMALDPSYLADHKLTTDAVRGWIPISAFLYVEETAPDRDRSVWGEDPATWLAASVRPYVAPGKGPMLLIYADGDDGWRRDQNDRFGEAMEEAGNHVRVVEVPDRNHGSLMSEMNADDDRIGDLVLEFIRGRERR